MENLFVLRVVGEDLFINKVGDVVTGMAACPMSDIDAICAQIEQRINHQMGTMIIPITGGKCHVKSTENFQHEISDSR
jgi:hypothetical protein